MKRFDLLWNLFRRKKKKQTRLCVQKRKLQILFGYHPAEILLDLLRRNGFDVSVCKFTSDTETDFHLELKDLAAKKINPEWMKTRLKPKS